MNKPLLLITNDDSISAKGINFLTEVVKPLGECFVLAPNSHQSGQAQAITVTKPLFTQLLEKSEDFTVMTCDGTPVDCVKLAVHKLLPRKPDLILSGINHGSNASTNIMYSGTMGAASEGCMLGIPSIGFSLCDYSSDADFSHTRSHLLAIVEEVLKNGLPQDTCLNVNFPKASATPLRGVKVVRQGKGVWREWYDEHQDPRGNPFYWIAGTFEEDETREGYDLSALTEQYVTIQPVHVDRTATSVIAEMANRFNRL